MNMTLPTAEFIFFWANWILVAALGLGVVATYLVVVSGNVKEAVAKKETLEARKMVAEAGATASEANKKAAEATERAAIANKAAEAERLERLKLEEVVAPRSLDIGQQFAISLDLREFAGKVVAVETYALDTDAASLASEILGVLQQAGLKAQNSVASIMPLGGFATGIYVTGKDDALAQSLRSSLVNIGKLTVAPAQSDKSDPPSTSSQAIDATILIGAKPLPMIGSKPQ